VPLHPLYKSIGPLLDDFILEHPFLKNRAPFVLALPHPSTPSEPSSATSKPGADIFSSSMNVTREAMEATGHAFVAIGASMDVRKWSWPGYLTFHKGVPPKTVSQDEPVDGKKSPEEKPDGGVAADSVAGESDPPHPETGLRGEVDRESLHEAMSTGGRELFHENAPLQEENAPATADDSTSQPEAAIAVEEVTLPTTTTSDYSQDEQDPSPPVSPSTPIIHLPDLTSPPSPSSSQSTLPVPVPPPSFRSFSLHFSPQEDPLATVPSRVLYITVSEHFGARSRWPDPSQKEQLTLAFLEPTPTISEDDNIVLYQSSSALLANVQGLIDHDEASNTETPVTAAKILQPKDKYLIAKHNDTTVTSAEFASHSEHLFNGSQMIA
jgi:hypothetical protein